jgi:DNA-directed RNA polymerase subunit RPC12/RpoP
MESNCAICDTEIEVEMCCSGYMCGCMGMPVDPPVCSDECYDKYMDNRDKVKTTPVVIPEFISKLPKDIDSLHGLWKIFEEPKLHKMQYYKRLREHSVNLKVNIGSVIPQDYSVTDDGTTYAPDFTNVSYWENVTKEYMKGKLIYKCSDCQKITPLKNNGEITVGFCQYCEHPLWND